MHAQTEQTLGAYRRAGPLPTVLRDLLSVEMCFIMFIFAGRYKALPEFQVMPVDPTMLFFILTLGLIVHRYGTRQLTPMAMDTPDLLMLSFCALGIISVFWSSLEPKNIDKTWRFALVGISGYFFASILAQEKERRERLVRLVIGFSAALLLYYAAHRWIIGIDIAELQYTGRIRGNNYLEYGAHASYLFLGCLALAIFGPRRWLLTALAGAIGSLFVLALIGARGALVLSLLGIPLAGAAVMMNRGRFAAGGGRLLLFLGILAGAAWGGYMALIAIEGFAGATEQLYTLERLFMHLSNEATSSLDLREEGRQLAFQRWLELPLLGWGMGEFRLQHSIDFPHNLPLEVLMEMGLVGAILFIPVQIIAVVACVRVVRDPAADWVDMAIVLIFVTEFVSHMTVQGYLAESRIYFALLALVIGLHRASLRRAAERWRRCGITG